MASFTVSKYVCSVSLKISYNCNHFSDGTELNSTNPSVVTTERFVASDTLLPMSIEAFSSLNPNSQN
jgi:hypothetical protein